MCSTIKKFSALCIIGAVLHTFMGPGVKVNTTKYA